MEDIKKILDDNKHSILVALIGENPSTYSMSRVMWNSAFAYHCIDAEYIPFDVPAEELEESVNILLSHDKVKGFNVTNPYKEQVAKYDKLSLDNNAQILGAVNTVVNDKDCARGYSTDGYGAVRSIQEKYGKDSLDGKNILVLGAGGSGSAIAVACLEYGNVAVANRTLEKAVALSERASIIPIKLYSDVFFDSLRDADVVINTLPVEKKHGIQIFKEGDLDGKQKICMDVVYGHHSYFLEMARSNDHDVLDGRMMLLHQGIKAFEHIIGVTDVYAPMRYALDNLRFDEDHITAKMIESKNS